MMDQPRQAGYNATTRVAFSRLAVPMLLDSGSTTCAILEEVVMAIIAETIRAFRAGEITQKSDTYPVVRIYKYRDPDSMPLSGVMAKAKTRTYYAIVLRTQFVPEGESTGPWKDIR